MLQGLKYSATLGQTIRERGGFVPEAHCLPCSIVYLAMTAAAVSADPVCGSFVMIGFGLGTVPAKVGFSFFPRLASVRLRSKINAILPAFTLLVGVLLILRGLNLGIPFLSSKLLPGSSAPMMHNDR